MKNITLGSALVILIVGMVVNPIVHGWALVKLWSWFIYPYFDVPMITIPVAIGISLIVGMLAVKSDRFDSKNKQSAEDGLAQVIGNAFTPVFVVLIGWIVTQFMG